MAGRYRGRHVAGNTERPAAEPVEEIPEDELLEAESKGHYSATSVKEGGERLKDR